MSASSADSVAHQYWVDPTESLEVGLQVTLDGEEAHHAARVSRLRVGERIRLSDGRGTAALAEATEVSAERVSLRVAEVEYFPPSTPALWLAQALAKSGRDEAAIEAATEVGVAGIIPLSTERAIVKWEGMKAVSARKRWQRITSEAAKQSMQPWCPDVSELTSVAELAAMSDYYTVIVLDPRATKTLAEALEGSDPQRPIVIAVGPEGGFTEAELGLFGTPNSCAVRLGPGILRASTAGPVALALAHEHLGHWNSGGKDRAWFVD